MTPVAHLSAACTAHSILLLKETLLEPSVLIDCRTCREQLNFTRFANVANAAMGRTLNPPFDPFKDDLSFLIGSYIFEDVGVSAYRVRPVFLAYAELGAPRRGFSLTHALERFLAGFAAL